MIATGGGDPIRREFSRLLSDTDDDLAALAPKPNGQASAVVVLRETGIPPLDRPYAAGAFRDGQMPGTTETDPKTVRRSFAAALAALSPLPRNLLKYFRNASDKLAARTDAEFTCIFVVIVLQPDSWSVNTGHGQRWLLAPRGVIASGPRNRRVELGVR